MTIEEINRLKVGDKIKINAFHHQKGRVKETRVIKQILDHNDPTTYGYPHLAVNRIIVDCFNESYQLSLKEILTAYNSVGEDEWHSVYGDL